MFQFDLELNPKMPRTAVVCALIGESEEAS